MLVERRPTVAPRMRAARRWAALRGATRARAAERLLAEVRTPRQGVVAARTLRTGAWAALRALPLRWTPHGAPRLPAECRAQVDRP